MKYNYKDYYKKYDMSGIINIGTGIVKVHNIFDVLPDFMKQADCLFIDVPGRQNDLSSYYTKAGLTSKVDYNSFFNRLFECIDAIGPNKLFIEVFKDFKDKYIDACKQRYKYVKIYDSFYFNNKNNKCWIIHSSNENIDIPLHNIDEEKAIERICDIIGFDCIGDLLMGQGLVGYYANKYNRKFVGTELNKKRLAVLLERINTNNIKV